MNSVEIPKMTAMGNHYERQISKLRNSNFPQAHDLACRLWEEAFQEVVFAELYKQFEDIQTAEKMGQSMLLGTYSLEPKPFMRAAYGFHFLKKFVGPYRLQYSQILRNVSDPVDDNEKYQMFLERYCVMSFFEYLIYFLDEKIARGNLRKPLEKEEVFISYSTLNKMIAGKIKTAFGEMQIDSFMAHEDIQPSQDWQKTILEHLAACTVFIPLITDKFMESEWTQQETGIAMSNPEIVILPICVSGPNPPGFLARYQALKIAENEISAWTIGEALLARKPVMVLDYFIRLLKNIGSFRGAENLMKIIMPFLELLNTKQIVEFADGCIKNAQVWSAMLCRTEMIPEFIRQKRELISKDRLEVLEYQIDKNEWWPANKST